MQQGVAMIHDVVVRAGEGVKETGGETTAELTGEEAREVFGEEDVEFAAWLMWGGSGGAVWGREGESEG